MVSLGWKSRVEDKLIRFSRIHYVEMAGAGYPPVTLIFLVQESPHSQWLITFAFFFIFLVVLVRHKLRVWWHRYSPTLLVLLGMVQSNRYRYHYTSDISSSWAKRVGAEDVSRPSSSCSLCKYRIIPPNDVIEIYDDGLRTWRFDCCAR